MFQHKNLSFYLEPWVSTLINTVWSTFFAPKSNIKILHSVFYILIKPFSISIITIDHYIPKIYVVNRVQLLIFIMLLVNHASRRETFDLGLIVDFDKRTIYCPTSKVAFNNDRSKVLDCGFSFFLNFDQCECSKTFLDPKSGDRPVLRDKQTWTFISFSR